MVAAPSNVDMLEFGQAGFGAIASSNLIVNNTTAFVIKAAPGLVFGVQAFNNSTTIAYVKLYNATSATAGSGTPYWRGLIPAPAAGGGGIILPVPMAAIFDTGICLIVTTGIADNDTGAPAATTYIVNVLYK